LQRAQLSGLKLKRNSAALERVRLLLMVTLAP
jgi:hypothetical protein